MSEQNRARTAAAYSALRARVTTLTADLPPERLRDAVPACPGWSVQDVVAHVVGVCHDVVTGRADTSGSPEWTARHVAERRERGIDDLLTEWERDAPAMDVAMRTGAGRQVLMDTLTHEQDVRGALGVPYRPSDADLAPALDFLTRGFSWTMSQRADLPSVQVKTSTGTYLLGEGEPGAFLTTDALDLLRTLSGRRTPAQIEGLLWDRDPTAWLPAFTWHGFVPPSEPIEAVLAPAL